MIMTLAAILALIAAGCSEENDKGDETAVVTATVPSSGQTAASSEPDCDLEAPSIIPESSGKAQHVYFYRDT
jgi:predicted outer membrane protein